MCGEDEQVTRRLALDLAVYFGLTTKTDDSPRPVLLVDATTTGKLRTMLNGRVELDPKENWPETEDPRPPKECEDEGGVDRRDLGLSVRWSAEGETDSAERWLEIVAGTEADHVIVISDSPGVEGGLCQLLAVGLDAVVAVVVGPRDDDVAGAGYIIDTVSELTPGSRVGYILDRSARTRDAEAVAAGDRRLARHERLGETPEPGWRHFCGQDPGMWRPDHRELNAAFRLTITNIFGPDTLPAAPPAPPRRRWWQLH